MTRPAGVALRRAVPDELATILAIDDDTVSLFQEHGLGFELSDAHPFVRAEHRRWRAAIEAGRVWLAVMDREGSNEVLGFVATGQVDREPYLDQLSVRRASMRSGVGSLLLRRVIEEHVGHDVWLTTYAHLPWNRPYYERAGFEVVEENVIGPELRNMLEQQRGALPHPEQRVAMRRTSHP